MKRSFVFAAALGALLLCSCAKKETDTGSAPANQRATVTMKDGTVNVGNVVASSSKEVIITGDDKITRTIPMDQVRSIEYSDAAAEAPAAAPPEANAVSPEPEPQAKPAPSRPLPGRQALAPEPKSAAPVEKLQPEYELPAGTQLAVRTFELIDSAKATEGQTFSGEITRAVRDAAGDVVIPARSAAQIVIRSASKGGRVTGASDLALDLKSVTIGGRSYLVQTGEITKVGKSGVGANKRTATYTGGGAALGAIIGAIAGGGKGAAIGAASGAGAGALTQIVTKGSSIKVPAETILTFKLEQPLRVTAAQ